MPAVSSRACAHSCALSQSPLASHHSACSAKLRPSGGACRVVESRNDCVSMTFDRVLWSGCAAYLGKQNGRASPAIVGVRYSLPDKIRARAVIADPEVSQGEHNRESAAPPPCTSG